MWPLLLALTLLGPERQTAPHPYQPPPVELAAPAVALAHDAHGVAMAWSMPNAAGQPRIHVTRLDRLGVAGEAYELPPFFTHATTAALHPSLARRAGADGFLVTWLEQPATRPQAAYTLLDASLAPAPPVLLPGVNLTSPPLAHTSGGRTWLASNASYWEIEANGSARGPFSASAPATDMTATAAGPRLVSGVREPDVVACADTRQCRIGGLFGCASLSCFVRTPWYSLRLVVPSGRVEGARFQFRSDSGAAIESDGERLVVAWFRGTQSAGGEVVLVSTDPALPGQFESSVQAPLVVGRFGPDSGPTRPDLAVTARGTFVVWRTSSATGDHDIAGALLARDGTVEQFTVAGSPADERDPSILALENGLLLVAYRKIEGNQSRIAWRFVGEQGKRRSVR